jgi:hypothetical protein
VCHRRDLAGNPIQTSRSDIARRALGSTNWLGDAGVDGRHGVRDRPGSLSRTLTGARQYMGLSANPRGYCPIHATGVKLPDDFAIPVTPLQYVD